MISYKGNEMAENKKKPEIFMMNGKKYYYSNGKWLDSSFLAVNSEEMYKLNNIRLKSLDFEDTDYEELIKTAQSMKDSDDYLTSRKIFETILNKTDDTSVIRSILPRYTSILRKLQNPREAITLFRKYADKYGRAVLSPALLTSLAGAYCDENDPIEARKMADRARAMSGANASVELMSVYARIKSLEK